MKRTIGIFGIIAIFLIAGTFSALVTPYTYDIDLKSGVANGASGASDSSSATTTLATPVALHIRTPASVKGVYMSGMYASSHRLRGKLVDLVDKTELNTIVLDIKDSHGRIVFNVNNPLIKNMGSGSNLVPDIREFIAELHEKGIYVIGRIATFQDSYLAKKFPEYAVKTKAGAIWGDRKGVHWIDAGALPVWEYIATLSEESYALGFDEINFDYIRFPSDGNMSDTVYPYSGNNTKSEVIKSFFSFIDKRLRPQGIPISADLFGMVTSVRNDLGIGQVLENALAHFDYVSPMVYPSHYPPNFIGLSNPNVMPYETVYFALESGVERARAFANPSAKTAKISNEAFATSTSLASVAHALTVASTTPIRTAEIRPWLQDFSFGNVSYTPALVRKQIDATYDAGLNSWLLWNASNVYTPEALR